MLWKAKASRELWSIGCNFPNLSLISFQWLASISSFCIVWIMTRHDNHLCVTKNSQAKKRTESLLFVFPSAIYVKSRINEPINASVIRQIKTLFLCHSLFFWKDGLFGDGSYIFDRTYFNCQYHRWADESSVKSLVLPESAVVLNVENDAIMVLIL